MKRRRRLNSILILLMAFVFVLSFVACTPPNLSEPGDDTEEEAITRTQIITNGTFYKVSNSSGSSSYMKETVTGWTATTGTLSKNDNGVTAGAIDLQDETGFNANLVAFSKSQSLEYPGVDPETPEERDEPGVLQDTNALLLASVETAGSIYYKNDSNFSLEKNKYYRLQFSVLTDIVNQDSDGNKGAWVIVDGGVYAEYARIDTKGKWETYELFIESNNYESRDIKIRLWLGHGPAKVNLTSNTVEDNPYLTQGAALFDNLICEEVDAADYNAARLATSDKKQTASMIFADTALQQNNEQSISTSTPNYFYSFRPGSNSVSNAANYALITGADGLSSNKPTVKENYTGIIDMSKMWYKDGDTYKDTYNEFFNFSTFSAPNRADFLNNFGQFELSASSGRTGALTDTKALMIFHNQLSAAGYKSNKSLLIQKNKYYTISVWVYVWNIDVPKPTSADLNYVTEPTAPTTERPTMKPLAEAIVNTATDYIVKLNNEASADTFLAELEKNVGGAVKYLGLADGDTRTMREVVEDAVDNWTGDLTGKELGELESDYIAAKNAYNTALATEEAWVTYDEKNAAYINAVAEWMVKYDRWRNGSVDGKKNASSTVDGEGETVWEYFPKAHIKVTGAGDIPAVYTDGGSNDPDAKGVGVWQQLSINVKGNQLSDRKINFEMWFGEGSTADYSNLMLGGAIFDDISISVSDSPMIAEGLYHELTPLADSSNADIGELITTPGGTSVTINDENNGTQWNLSSAEKVAAEDILDGAIKAEIVEGKDENGNPTYPVTINDVSTFYNFLKYSHSKYSASSIELKPDENEYVINPNTCYRISMWVRTEGIDSGFGATIALLTKQKDTEDEYTSVSSFTTYNSEDWQELVFYVKGDSLETNFFTLSLSMGTGTRFSTASYVKGDLYITAITMSEIKYSEYNSSTKSGDQTKSYAFSNTSASTSISNGSFGSIDLSNIAEDDLDADGNLINVVKTDSWTNTSVASNSYNKPTLKMENEVDKYYLKWEGVVNADPDSSYYKPDGYEIYISNLKRTDDKGKDKTENNYYIGYVAYADAYETAGSGDAEVKKYRFEIPADSEAGNFTVKPVSAKGGVGTVSNSIASIAAAAQTADVKYTFTEYTDVPKCEYNIGTINYKSYDQDGVAGADYASIFDGSDYVSPYSTLFMISSNYELRIGAESSTKTLSANTYYEIRVWMKTIGADTRASITFNDISSVLDTQDTYAGYVDQNTGDKWVQYRFIIATGDVSESITLVLSLGNPYARGESVKAAGATSATTMYRDNVTSTGTVFFDNIVVTELTEDQYTVYQDGEFTPASGGDKVSAEEIEYKTEKADATLNFAQYEMVFTNAFAFKNLVFTTDSFDSYVENTKTEEETGYALGHTPNAYTWGKAENATDTDDARLYGVYSAKDLANAGGASDALIGVGNTEFEDPFKDFLPADFDLARFLTGIGDNVLVLSNLTNNGQHYTLKNSKTIAAKSYYKITFKAKLLAAEGATAEFRYYGDISDDAAAYKSIGIFANSEDLYEFQEYSYYIYNEDETATKSIKWGFALGGNTEESKMKGLLVIDDVRFETSEKDVFEAAKTAYEAEEEDARFLLGYGVHKYDKSDSDSGTDDPTDDDDGDDDKTSIFDRGDIWLLVSTIIIGAAIIATVIVVLVKRVKKKHKKPVKGENVVKTDKVPIEVITATDNSTVKDDADDDEEFIDRKESDKPKYVQRTVSKKKKKK